MQPENKNIFNDIEADLKTLDPIETAAAEYDDSLLADQALVDIEHIDEILANDRTITPLERNELLQMGCNLRLEWLYSRHGGGQAEMTEFNARWDEADAFMRRAKERAASRQDKFPGDYWSISRMHLDLRALQAHRNARDSQTTLRGTNAGRQAWELADSQMQGVIMDSTRLMQEMVKHTQRDDLIGRDARGKLYEVLMVSYARLRTYENENFDEVFVRSALEREDQPRGGQVYPKRSFDIVVESGGTKDLIQTKNNDDDVEYAYPIRKVKDTRYHKTLRNLPRFVDDFKLIVNNPADPRFRAELERAYDELDRVFGRQLDAKPARV